MKKKTKSAPIKSSSLATWLTGTKLKPNANCSDTLDAQIPKNGQEVDNKSLLQKLNPIPAPSRSHAKVPVNKFQIRKLTTTTADVDVENMMPPNNSSSMIPTQSLSVNVTHSFKSNGTINEDLASGTSGFYRNRSKAHDEYEQQLLAALEESARDSAFTKIKNLNHEDEYPSKKACMEHPLVPLSQLEMVTKSSVSISDASQEPELERFQDADDAALVADLIYSSTSNSFAVAESETCCEVSLDCDVDDNQYQGILKGKVTSAELIYLKQQAITDFIIAGGTRKLPLFLPRPTRNISDPRCMTSFGFVCRTPQLEPLSCPLEITGGYLKSEAAALCARRLQSAAVQFQRAPYGGARVGVSVARFDAFGELVAIAGSNGIIRVFEFLECLGRLQTGNAAEVPAVVILDAKKDVSDISWSLTETDDIAVAFTSLSWIHIYDLCDTDSPKLVLEATRGGGHGVVQYVQDAEALSASSGDRSGDGSVSGGATNAAVGIDRNGPASVYQALPKAKAQAKVSRVLAGSTYGKIRLWSCSRPGRPLWEIPADPYVHTPHSSQSGLAVVSLCQRPEKGQLVMLNKAGVVCIFDVVNLKVASFASNGSPVCLQRLDPWGPQPLGGLGPGLGSNPAPVDLHMSAADAEEACARLVASSGQLLRLDLRTQRLSPALATIPPRSAVQEDDEGFNSAAAAFERKLASAPYCNSAALPLLGGEVSCVAVHGSTSLQLLGPGGTPSSGRGVKFGSTTIEHSLQISSGGAAGSSSSFQSSSSSSSGSSVAFTNQAQDVGAFVSPVMVAPPMMKTVHISLCLPGHVIEAEPGSADVLVSQDLRAYLASRAAAASSPSRSDRVYFDWTPRRLLGDTISAPALGIVPAIGMDGDNSFDQTKLDQSIPFFDSCGRGHLDGYEATLSYITGYTLTLTEPYFGPTIKSGKPKISLRTNLAPTARSSASLASPSEQQPLSQASSVTPSPIVLSELQFSQPATALAAHPSLPYVLAGFVDDSIVLLAPSPHRHTAGLVPA